MSHPAPATHDFAEGPTVVDVGEYDSRKRRQVSGPGLRTFLNITESWALTEEDRLRVLGRPGRSTYHLWVSKARGGSDLTLPLDTLLRISAVLGVHKALAIIFRNDAEAIDWLKSPNRGTMFGGQAPLELVTSGTQDGIMLVRRYLDAWRGGVFAAPIAEFDGNAPAVDDGDIVFL